LSVPATDSQNSQQGASPPEKPWARPVSEVVDALGVDRQSGLSGGEVSRRRKRSGANTLGEARSRPAWRIAYEQVKSITIVILAVAGALAVAMGSWPEGIAILAVILLNTGIGFISEWRAARAMESLRQMAQPQARLRRDGREQQEPTRSLVPGDIVIIAAGDVVPADIRLVEANGLKVDESALTGESESVTKHVETLEAETELADRANMLFKGTQVTEGSGEGVVTAVGTETELGRISELAEQVQEQKTPLEHRLASLGKRMAFLALGSAALIAVAGVFVGQPIRLIIATSIALGVAAVPEGLPIVANLALARGMWLMSRRNALINRLPAVETLGTTDLIFTDKTGTLTENRMTVRRYVTAGGEFRIEVQENHGPPEDELVRKAIEIGLLCCNASLADDEDHNDDQGDPTELALLEAGRRFGLSREALLEDRPETREESFDTATKMMATFHRDGEGFYEAIKGAPQAVLPVATRVARPDGDAAISDEDRESWNQQADELAGEGLRVLALADRQTDSDDVEPYQDLRLVGLVAMYDPPRDGVDSLIQSCRQAGIRVVMVTGDQPRTAASIARQVSIVTEDEPCIIRARDMQAPEDLDEDSRDRILNCNVFARFSPEQKLDLVEIYQEAGHVVSMTGDGINDTPALKSANIGIAMGKRGTDSAREAADMVLQDDAFASIVAAIRQGRVIFGNIRKAVMFMLCTNVAEVLAVAIASVTGAPLPLLPLQILYLNMLTDVLPALGLGAGTAGDDIMHRDPRDASESIMTRRHWLALAGWGLTIAGCVLAALATGLLVLDLPKPAAVTLSFVTLGLAKLWFVYNLRDRQSHWLRNSICTNKWIWAAEVLCIALLLAAVYMPGLSNLLGTRPIAPLAWVVVLGLSVVPVIVGQAIRLAGHLRDQ
jgi:Ca2+-transporting ATPase